MNLVPNPLPRLRRAATAFAGALALLAAAAPQSAWAHKSSDAYLRLAVADGVVHERLDVALRDLDRDLALDADGDGRLTWGEVRGRWADLQALAARHVRLAAGGQDCTPLPAEGPAAQPQLDDHSDGAHAVLQRRWQCAAPLAGLTVHYDLFADTDPQHRGILRVDAAPGADTAGTATALHTAVLVPGPQAHTVAALAGPADGESSEAAPPSSFAGFVAEGVHHILIGTDHVLFLLALLLPAVLVRAGRGAPRGSGGGGSAPPAAAPSFMAARMSVHAGTVAAPWGHLPARAWAAGDAEADEEAKRRAPAAWQAAPAWRPVCVEVLKVVTAFSVAHSLTLAMAVLGWVDPPSRWVESIIAASVAFAALNNLRPWVAHRWGLTFAFGLVHGFGFAGALRDLGLGGGSLAAPLLGFNLGVELGQLAIVAVFLPLAWALRGTALYRRGVLQAGSVAIAAIALAWCVERVFDLSFMPL